MNTHQTITTNNTLIESNPITGDSMEIVQSAGLSAEGTTRIRVVLAPISKGAPPLHFHRRLRETFTVEKGVLFVQVGKAKRQLAAGESVEIAPGTPHRFWNPDTTETVTFVTEVTPGTDFERFLRQMYRLAQEGKTHANGMPRSLMHLIQVIEWGDIWLVGVPVFVQQILRKALRGMGQIFQEANRLEAIVPFL